MADHTAANILGWQGHNCPRAILQEGEVGGKVSKEMIIVKLVPACQGEQARHNISHHICLYPYAQRLWQAYLTLPTASDPAAAGCHPCDPQNSPYVVAKWDCCFVGQVSNLVLQAHLL